MRREINKYILVLKQPGQKDQYYHGQGGTEFDKQASMAIEFDTLSDAQIAMEVITRDNAENIKDGAVGIAPIHSRLKSVTVHDIIMTQQGDKQIPRPKQKPSRKHQMAL